MVGVADGGLAVNRADTALGGWHATGRERGQGRILRAGYRLLAVHEYSAWCLTTDARSDGTTVLILNTVLDFFNNLGVVLLLSFEKAAARNVISHEEERLDIRGPTVLR